MRNTKIIALEGAEKVGKTSVINALQEIFREDPIKVLFVREPGMSEVGKEVREVLLKNRPKRMPTMAEIFGFAMARSCDIEEVVLPAYLSGEYDFISQTEVI